MAVIVAAPHQAVYTLVPIATLINEHNWAHFTDEDTKAETGKLLAQGHDLTPKSPMLLPLALRGFSVLCDISHPRKPPSAEECLPRALQLGLEVLTGWASSKT